jgi:transposase-like protein
VTLLDINRLFSTDEKCRAILTKLRWPKSVECPRCKSKKVSWLSARKQYECAGCQYQFSVTAGTIFNDSHLSLEKWFIAVYLIGESRKGISANQLRRIIGGSYKTAWYLCHRIRASMRDIEPTLLDGFVEVDETYVGGKSHGRMGRGSPNKEVVIGIRKRNGDLRFFHAKDVTSGTLGKYIQENISENVDVLMTDDFRAYKRATKHLGPKHKVIKHTAGVYVNGNIHTNSVESAFSLLKRGIIGTWHKISAKHLAAYLNEMTFRFNRRKRSDLFLDTLRHMVTTPTLTFETLTTGISG